MMVNKTLDYMHTAIMRITAAEADSAPNQFDLYKLFPAIDRNRPNVVLRICGRGVVAYGGSTRNARPTPLSYIPTTKHGRMRLRVRESTP